MSGPGRPTREEALEMTLLGLDWGSRRIGLAVKPRGLDYALPSVVVAVGEEAEAIEAVDRRIGEAGADGVVVGLPVHPDERTARAVRRFCRKTRARRTGVRWFFVDERFTSQEAETISLESTRQRASDDLAAALILTSFLQSCR